jgi:hypothetical protein
MLNIDHGPETYVYAVAMDLRKTHGYLLCQLIANAKMADVDPRSTLPPE